MLCIFSYCVALPEQMFQNTGGCDIKAKNESFDKYDEKTERKKEGLY